MARRETPQEVAARAIREAQRLNAPHIVQKALIEAGIVESGLQHAKYSRVGSGDRDSVGFLQQRPSAGWGPAGQSIEADTKQFLQHANALLAKGFKGSSGELAQAVQRSAYPARYAQQSGAAEKYLRGGTGAAGSSAGGTTTTSTTTSGTPDLGSAQSALPLIQALTASQQQAPSSSIQAPSFTAQAVMPQGFGTVSSGPSIQQGADIGTLAAAVKTLGGNVPQSQVSQQTLQGVTSSGGAAGAAGSPSVHTSGYPTGRTGKIIGTPHTGTHTLGNWQSDNAVDISVPKGTAMVALEGGTVVKVKHHPQNGGRFAGDQITIRGADGNSFFYAHGVAGVKPGQKVHRGDVLGTTGVANGVPHLHFGVEKGDPRKIIGRGR